MEKANILTVGENITVDIKKQGINGEGIGYHQQMAVFVPGAIAQESVTCEITATKPGFAIGKIIEILKKSEKRVEPPCEYYEKCGGCQMQHIQYAEQLKSKRHLLLQSLRRYTDQNADKLDIRKTIGMKTTFGYRNKSQMPFANTNYGLSLGLYEVNSNHFVAVDECIVQDAVVNEVNAKVLAILIERNLVANDHVNKEGVLLNLVTRYMKSSGSAQVTLVVTRKLPELPAIAADIMNRIPAVKSVFYSINAPKNLSMFGKAIELLQGAPQISERIGDLELKLSPDAFHQLNTDQMLILYQEIAKAAALTGAETVIDCYSGVGIISLMLAKMAGQVVGIDYSEASIRDAKANAVLNRIKNVSFIQDRVEKALPLILAKRGIPDVIVFDPPRTGLEDSTIAEVIQSKAKRIVYVSCNPSTLAKNLNDFEPFYDIAYIQPIDMFPHTAGVESVTLLKRKVL